MKTLVKWLYRKVVGPEPKIVVRVHDQTQITLDEWRSQPDLVKKARSVLDDPTFRVMIDVLRTSHFMNYTMGMTGVSPDDRAAMQARGEGYTACLSNIEALGVFSKPEKEEEETFEPEESPTIRK